MSGSAQTLYGQTGPPEYPSQQSEGIGYPGLPTLADRDLLGKLMQDQVGTARPERRLYTEYAAGQETNAEHLTYRGVKKFCITNILYRFSTSSAIISNLF